MELDLVAIQRWLGSPGFLWNALILIGVVFAVFGLSRALKGGLADTIRRAFTTNWQLTLLATTAFVLSVASGWTTWDGMRNFTGEPILSLMITFGIQGVMLIIAWLIGESFAAGMAAGRGRAGNRSAATVAVGLIVGTLVFSALSLLGALQLGLIDPMRPAWAFMANDKLVSQVAFGAFAVLLLTPLVLRSRSGLVADYVNGVRLIVGNAVLWLMFLACMATSVFFSFDSLFSSIFPDNERKRAADIRAVNQVAGVVADIGTTAIRRRIGEAEELFRSPSWAAYERELDKAARLAAQAPEKIREEMVRALREQESRVARLQEVRSTSEAGQAGLVQRKTVLSEELTRLVSERPAAATAAQEQKAVVSEIEKRLDEQRAKVMAEEKGVEGSGKVGRGSFWRAAKAEEEKVTAELQVARERLRGHDARLTSLDRRIASLKAELAQIDGDLAKLKGESETAQQMITVARSAGRGTAEQMIDPAATSAALERERQSFRQKPDEATLARIQQQCATLQAVSLKVASLRDEAAAIDCDPRQAVEAASRVFALNVGLVAFERNCVGGDKLPQTGGIDAMLTFGRKCLQDSGLPSRDAAELGSRLQAIDLSRDDKAHRFVVTWNAFADGNRLAYLALAIAIAIDALVFMSGLFGANAIRSPLTDLDGRTELTPEQLEAAIDATLRMTADPARTLAGLVTAQHPIVSDDGFSAEIRLDERDPRFDDMRAVLSAGATIGAVRPVGHGGFRYLIKTGLSRYLAVAQKKNWSQNSEELARKELVTVVGVALLPTPMTNADVVLAELHPISDLKGFAAEVYLSRIPEESRRRLVRGVLGAAATVVGSVDQDKKEAGRYYVSNSLYRTLLLIRSGVYAAYRDPPPAGTMAPRQLESAEAPRRLTAEPVRQITDQSHDVLKEPAGRVPPPLPPTVGPRAAAAVTPAPTQAGVHTRQAPPAIDSALVARYVDALLGRLAIQATAGNVNWLAGDEHGRPLAAGEALEKLASTRMKLGHFAKDLESRSRQLLDRAVEAMEFEAGEARPDVDALREAAGIVYRQLPMLLLLPEGGFEATLADCIGRLQDAAAPDNGHRDHVETPMLAGMRRLAAALAEEPRDTYESWRRVEELLLAYEEPRARVVDFRERGRSG